MQLPLRKQLGPHVQCPSARLQSAASSRRGATRSAAQAAAVTDRAADSVAATEPSNGSHSNDSGNGAAYGGGTVKNGSRNGSGPVILNGQVQYLLAMHEVVEGVCMPVQLSFACLQYWLHEFGLFGSLKANSLHVRNRSTGIFVTLPG